MTTATKTTTTKPQTLLTDAQKTVVLTKQAIVDLLKESKGAKIVTLITQTEPKMRKTDNPYIGKVIKVSRVNGMIGWNYSNSVNNQREREGMEADFQAKPRHWGERIEGTPLVEHKGNYYIELKVERSLGHSYQFTDGTPLTDEQVEELQGFMPKPRKPQTQQTDKTIILRDYRLDTIMQLTMDKVAYQIK